MLKYPAGMRGHWFEQKNNSRKENLTYCSVEYNAISLAKNA